MPEPSMHQRAGSPVAATSELLMPRRAGGPVRMPESFTPRRARSPVGGVLEITTPGTGGPSQVMPEVLTPRRTTSPVGAVPEITVARTRSPGGVVPEAIKPRRTISRSLSRSMSPTAAVPNQCHKMGLLQVDVPQLRQWFDQMDADRSGHVTKEQFLNFIRAEPCLRILFSDEGESQCAGPREALARRRRQGKLWEEFCCGKETLGMKEFTFFFRRRGWLEARPHEGRARANTDQPSSGPKEVGDLKEALVSARHFPPRRPCSACSTSTPGSDSN